MIFLKVFYSLVSKLLCHPVVVNRFSPTENFLFKNFFNSLLMLMIWRIVFSGCSLEVIFLKVNSISDEKMIFLNFHFVAVDHSEKYFASTAVCVFCDAQSIKSAWRHFLSSHRIFVYVATGVGWHAAGLEFFQLKFSTECRVTRPTFDWKFELS